MAGTHNNPINLNNSREGSHRYAITTFNPDSLFEEIAYILGLSYDEYLKLSIDLWKEQPTLNNLRRFIITVLDEPRRDGFDLIGPLDVDRVFAYYDNWYETKGDDDFVMVTYRSSKRNICKTVYPFIDLTAQPNTKRDVAKVFDCYRKQFGVEQWGVYSRTFISFYYDHLVRSKTIQLDSNRKSMETSCTPSTGLIILGGNHRLVAFREINMEFKKSKIE